MSQVEQKQQKQKKTKTPARRKRPAQSQELKCPFLEKLSKGKPQDESAYNKIRTQRIGDPSLQSVVRISVEPDSPSRSNQPVDVPNIDELTIQTILEYDTRILKKLMQILSDKIQLYQGRAAMLPQYRQEQHNKTQERYDLQIKLQKETEELKEQGQEYLEQLKVSNQERNEAVAELFQKKKEGVEIAHEISVLQSKIGSLQRENLILEAKKIRYNDTKQLLADSSELKENFQKGSGEIVSEINSVRENMKNNIKELEKEKALMARDLDQLQRNIEKIQQENTQKRDELNKLKFSITRDTFLVRKIAEAAQNVNIHHSNRQTVQQSLDQLAQQVNLNTAGIVEKHRDLLSQKGELTRQVADLSQTLAEKEETLLNLKIKLQQQHTTVATVEQLCCIRQDLNQLCEELSILKDYHNSLQSHIYAALQNSADFVIREGVKTLQESKLLDGMIDDIEDKESELECLKQLLSESNKHIPTYQPVRSDQIDCMLADYLNQNPQPGIQFIREDQGVYKYGGKKIQMKIEAGKLRVRFGGGYSSLEDFLTAYQHQENERTGSPSNRTVMANLGMSPSRTSAFATTFGIVSSSPGGRSPKK